MSTRQAMRMMESTARYMWLQTSLNPAVAWNVIAHWCEGAMLAANDPIEICDWMLLSNIAHDLWQHEIDQQVAA